MKLPLVHVVLRLLLALLGAVLAESSAVAAGLSRDAQEAIRSEIRRVIAEGYYPGISVLLIHQGKIVMREAHGVVNLDTSEPHTTGQLCWLASTSKLFTGVLMAMLVDDGSVSFDDPIAKFFPAFADIRLLDGSRPKQPVLLRQALSHTSGLPEESWLRSKGITKDDPAHAGYFYPKSPQEFVDACLAFGIISEPGTRKMYGSPIELAACVAQRATGQSFAELMERRVFAPLGLSETTIRPDAGQMARIAPLYQWRKAGEFASSSLSLEVARRENESMASAGGGIFSTLDDVGRLMLLHLNHGWHEGRQLVRTETLQRLYQKQPGARDYGLAMQIHDSAVNGRSRILSHPGFSGPVAWVDFERELAGVLLMQSNTLDRTKHHQRIIDTIYRFVPAKESR